MPLLGKKTCPDLNWSQQRCWQLQRTFFIIVPIGSAGCHMRPWMIHADDGLFTCSPVMPRHPFYSSPTMRSLCFAQCLCSRSTCGQHGITAWGREAIVPGDSFQVAQSQLPRCPEPLFLSQKRGALTTSAIEQIIAELVRAAGGLAPEETSAHTSRRTFTRSYLAHYPRDGVELPTLL